MENKRDPAGTPKFCQGSATFGGRNDGRTRAGDAPSERRSATHYLLENPLCPSVPAIPKDVRLEVKTATSEATALIREIEPSNVVEGMLASLIEATHTTAHDAMRRAARFADYEDTHRRYVSLGLKAARTCAQLIECLNHGRGKATVQRIVIERVNIEPGAQAVVGAVATTKSVGGGSEKAHQSHGPRDNETRRG
jgi:hypothetical protein